MDEIDNVSDDETCTQVDMSRFWGHVFDENEDTGDLRTQALQQLRRNNAPDSIDLSDPVTLSGGTRDTAGIARILVKQMEHRRRLVDAACTHTEDHYRLSVVHGISYQHPRHDLFEVPTFSINYSTPH